MHVSKEPELKKDEVKEVEMIYKVSKQSEQPEEEGEVEMIYKVPRQSEQPEEEKKVEAVYIPTEKVEMVKATKLVKINPLTISRTKIHRRTPRMDTSKVEKSFSNVGHLNQVSILSKYSNNGLTSKSLIMKYYL